MLVVAGTIPVKDLPLLVGEGIIKAEGLTIDGHLIEQNRGTAAMMTTVAVVCQEYGLRPPLCVTAGDIGKRDGSLKVYQYLIDQVQKLEPKVMAFHYLMPDIKKNNELVKAIKQLKQKPFLIADAGSMYVAKAGGHAPYYDIFTPDLGELAFLADEKADHPAYTRGFIWHMDGEIEELVQRAYLWKNAATTLLVKGRIDHICQEGKIIKKISEPCIREMEAIGGTGDTITGMITALCFGGYDPIEAGTIATQANRIAGKLARVTPATQVQKIIEFLPAALRRSEEIMPVLDDQDTLISDIAEHIIIQ